MSDNAKSKTPFAIRDILRLYTIKDQQLEPYYQHQNPIERCIQDVKRMVKSIMDRIGCPSVIWLLCTLYVIGLLNILVNWKGVIPLQAVTGYHIDIFSYLDFHFWEEVFLEDLRGGEQLACWCGPSHKQGDFLTYHILLSDTQQLVMLDDDDHDTQMEASKQDQEASKQDQNNEEASEWDQNNENVCDVRASARDQNNENVCDAGEAHNQNDTNVYGTNPHFGGKNGKQMTYREALLGLDNSELSSDF